MIAAPALGDDPIFAEGEIEFHGQVIFAVVAETREMARRAARLAKIEVAARHRRLRSKTRWPWRPEDVLPPYAFTPWRCRKSAQGRAAT